MTQPSKITHPAVPEHEGDKAFFGHPFGLANLFGVELWERFSFYGMHSVLLFYLYYTATEGGLEIDRHTATAIVGAYGGTLYLAAIVGGWVADRLLGPERTLFTSAIVIMFGHIALAILPGHVGLVVGLVSIALGAGSLKATASTVLGELYAEDDSRRDGGFSIFYMGINIGALLGPLLTGWVWEHYGFHWAFGTAAVGMAVGLAQYAALRKRTIGLAGHEVTNPLPKKQVLPVIGGGLVVAVVIGLLFGFGVLQVAWISDLVSLVAAIAAVVTWVLMYRSPLVDEKEKKRLIGFVPMFFASTLFFSIFKQQFTVLAIYSDKRLDRTFGSFTISPSWVHSINPIFIIVFSIVFAAMWTKLGDRQPSTPVKYALGTIIVGVAPFVFIPFAGGAENSTPFYVIVVILFLFTMAELLISPVGLSLATKLAPRAFPTRMMSLHLLSLSIGAALAGTFAGFYNPDDASAERTYFTVLGTAAIVLGAVVWLLSKKIIQLFQGVR